MYRLAPLKKTSAIEAALERIEGLEVDYAAAVQLLIGRGSSVSWELLVKPVDFARERTVQIGTAWATGKASEAEVVEAASALARLMEMVIGSEHQL